MLLENSGIPEDNRVCKEAKVLSGAGFDVTIICPMKRSRKWAESFGDYRVYRFPRAPEGEGLLAYAWEYAYTETMLFLFSLYVFFRRGFDVVHVHTPPDMTATIAIFYKLLGKKFVFDHHDLSPELYLARRGDEKKNLIYKVLRFFERLACRNADRLIATNETQRGVQINRCGADPKDCYVVRNGPHEPFLQDVAAKSDLRESGKLVLGYVGAIGIQDGVDYAVRVVHELKFKHNRDDFVLVIVGTGPAIESLKTLADELDVTDRIRFAGRIAFDLVPSYIAAFDVCLTPDPSNPYNDSCATIKTMEYMASKKPTVCFRTHENEVTAGPSALYADKNDVAAFTDLTVKLMDDPALRESMGQLGRNRIEDGMTWRHQTHHLLALYEGLMPHSLRGFSAQSRSVPAAESRDRKKKMTTSQTT